jgi:hypothetical protein
MRFAVTVISPRGYVHSAAFHEIAESLHYSLLTLGHESVITPDGNLPGRQHIVLGSNLLPCHPQKISPNAIIYNLEQVEFPSVWIKPELIDIFRRHILWDYSRQNANALALLGIKVASIVPVGYAKELTRIIASPERDIDVLFCGSLNPRRRKIIDQMRAAGLRTEASFGVYGKKRDALIGRAKLLLNHHFYDAKVLEIVRISYLLANRCAVLSECSADPEEDARFAGGIAFSDYEDLTARAHELIEHPEERERLAKRGFEIIRARPYTAYLHAALTQRSPVESEPRLLELAAG